MIETVETLDNLNDNLIEQMNLNNTFYQQQLEAQNTFLQSQLDAQNVKIDALTKAVSDKNLTIPDDAVFNFDLSELLNRLDSLNTANITFFNDITDIIIFFIAVVLGAISMKAFVSGAFKW